MPKIHIVPLGSNCSSTFLLQEIKMDKERNPFEWNTSMNIRKVVDLFKNNFNGFLDQEDISMNSLDGEFAFRNKHEMTFNHETRFNEVTKKYEITEDMRNDIYEKYKRRCQRCLDKINEADKVIFFRLPNDHYYYQDEKRHSFNNINDAENGQIIMNELKYLFNSKNVECYYIYNIDMVNNFLDYLKSLKSNPDNIFI